MTKRLFLSIALPDEMLRELAEWQRNYEKLRGARWTPVENLHITMVFLGDIEETRIAEMAGRLRNELGNLGRLEMEFNQVVLAPPNRLPRMIWADFSINQRYNELVEKVWQVAKDFVEPEVHNNRKRPLAHVTLARFRFPIYINNLKQPDIQNKSFEVSRVELMESELTAQRPYYRKLADFGLSNQ